MGKMKLLPKIGTWEGGWYRSGVLQMKVHASLRPPWGYGLAWWDFLSREAVCYPIPLNWIMWGLREIYYFLYSTPAHYKHPMWKEGYKVGRRDARLLRDCGNNGEEK